MKNLSLLAVRFCFIILFCMLGLVDTWAQSTPCIPVSYISSLDYTCGVGNRMKNVWIPGELGSVIKDTNMTCHDPQYRNSTATDSLVLVPGGTYKVDIDMDTPSRGFLYLPSVVIWIDFDNDGTFATSEIVGGLDEPSRPNLDSYFPIHVSFYFTIPPTVAPGTYVMRLHNEEYGPSGSLSLILPCSLDLGGIIDYKVRVACGSSPGAYSVTGPGSVCAGSSVAFAGSVPGGGWSSSNIMVATVDPSGNVTGAGLGLDTIKYSILDAGGCVATATQTVSVTSWHSQGPYLVSQFYPAQLTNAITGGIWSSSNTAIASVVPGTGDTAIVTGGTTLGPVTIYYSEGGCVDSKYLLNTYCTPGYTSAPTDNCYYGYYLASLSFTGEPGTSITDPSIDCVADGNADRSSIAGSASVLPGHTYNIMVTTPLTAPLTSSSYVIYQAVYQNVAVFADFANNGIYSPAQVIGGIDRVVSNDIRGNSYTFPVTIPAGTAPGAYHIRVRSASDGTAPEFTEMDGCSDYYVGVALNYIINVLCVPPTISCTGSNVTTPNDPGNCSAVVPAFPAAVVTGSIPTVTYSPAAGTAFATGVTTVTATATNGCGVATCSFTVTVNDAEKPTVMPADTTLSGCAPVAISLRSPAASDNCGIASLTNDWPGGPFPVGTSNVTWTATDVHGNTNTAVQHVTVNPATLTISATANNISCHGGSNGSIAASVSGGTLPYTYHWSTGAATTGISGLHTGTYSVTVTDAHRCAATQSYTVSQPAVALAASATASAIACRGGTTPVSVSGTGGTSPYTGTGTITGVSAGAHTFTISDLNGCTANTTITITQPATSLNATAASTVPIACNGGTTTVSVTATGGVSPYTGTGAMTGVAAGTHTYTVTDHAGCIAAATTTITQPTAVAATATASPIACSGGTTSVSVTASGGTGPYAGTGTFTGVAAGAHTYTVTDHKGCTGSATITVTEPAALSIAATVVNMSCGAAGSITTVISGGTLPYSYSWSNGSHTASITGLSAGTYTLTVNDAHGCHTSSTYTVGAAGPLSITGSVTNAECRGSSTGSIGVSVTGGTPAYTYTWSNGAHTASITGLAAGTYTVTVTDAPGCSASHSYTVTQPAALALTAVVANASCYGCGNGSISTTVSGGTAPYSYSWSNGARTACSAALAAGTYTVTVTDAHGCTVTGSYTVGQPAKGHSGGRNSGNEKGNLPTDDIKLYPNPTKDELNIAIPAGHKDAEITISSLDGKTIEKRVISDNDGQPVQFSLAGVPRGVYIVKVVAGDINYEGKVIAQ